MNQVLVQTRALALDAYRELNSKRLFWITLVLSGLVVACFAAVGINDKGLTILWWSLEIPGFNDTLFTPATFYKLIYTAFGIAFWLSWVATGLALVSTASIFPDLVSGGAIDLMLSKPISRLRLFLTKYVFGLFFVGLQVAVFSAASFLVIGIRGGAWEPGLFLAVPIVLVFFSYLYGLCVLFGVLTRSAIAALLLTALAWLMIFVVHSAEQVLLMQRVSAEIRVEELTKSVDQMAALENPSELMQSRLKDRRADLAEAEASVPTWQRWHRMIFAAKSVLPKTTETVNLLNRALIDMADLPQPPEDPTPRSGPFGGPGGNMRKTQERMQEIINSRSVWWVLGTSLLFETVVVGLAAVKFCRRDF
ncbi:MAG: ABC transporter permease [Phycisphaerales bacterium]|nr:ABC transporter permease [Phycisphaerales bacterium]